MSFLFVPLENSNTFTSNMAWNPSFIVGNTLCLIVLVVTCFQICFYCRLLFRLGPVSYTNRKLTAVYIQIGRFYFYCKPELSVVPNPVGVDQHAYLTVLANSCLQMPSATSTNGEGTKVTPLFRIPYCPVYCYWLRKKLYFAKQQPCRTETVSNVRFIYMKKK